MTTSATCSALYYPGQTSGCMAGHVDLEFDNTVYNLDIGIQLEVPLNKRITKAQNGGLPFEQFSFKITEKQAIRLRKILTSQRESYRSESDEPDESIKYKFKNPMLPPGYTCMDHVSNVLEKAQIMQMPKIIKLSPLLSSLYWQFLKSSGDNRVKNIARYGNSFSFGNFLIVNCCRLSEIGIIALSILAVANCIRQQKAIFRLACLILRQQEVRIPQNKQIPLSL